MKQLGVVLKQFIPKKRKVVLLDDNLGTIIGIPSYGEPVPVVGALISYTVLVGRQGNFLQNIELISIPFYLAKQDILFFHHVLELYYHFIPLGSCVPEMFELLQLIYESKQRFTSHVTKKVFLFKFFTTLGIYPEDAEFQTPYFHRLAAESIDTIASRTIDLKVERKLQQWLRRCVSMHPFVHEFKTVHFLYENRTP